SSRNRLSWSRNFCAVSSSILPAARASVTIWSSRSRISLVEVGDGMGEGGEVCDDGAETVAGSRPARAGAPGPPGDERARAPPHAQSGARPRRRPARTTAGAETVEAVQGPMGHQEPPLARSWWADAESAPSRRRTRQPAPGARPAAGRACRAPVDRAWLWAG